MIVLQQRDSFRRHHYEYTYRIITWSEWEVYEFRNTHASLLCVCALYNDFSFLVSAIETVVLSA